MVKHLQLHGLLLLSCVSLLLCAAGTATATIARGQREAGALLKWKAPTSTSARGPWRPTPPARAIGSSITCNSAGDVTGLRISSASLNGTLAALDFSAFAHLETLTLVQNDLYGAVPEATGNLTSLVLLVIERNQRLKGPIPRGVGRLKQLTWLRLRALGLDGAIPDEIGNLTSLKELYLDDNNMRGSIPPTAGKLKKLTWLDLSYNNLAGGIPTEIGNMMELQIASLAGNRLEGELQGALARLRKLSALFVANNQLRGDITPCLRNKSSLVEVNVAGNNFSKISAPAICAGGSLLHFEASSNWFAS